MKHGEIDWKMSDEGISMYKWKDKRSVHLLSNFHNPTVVTSVHRKQKDGEIIDVTCPQALVDYNTNMFYVDKFDQLKSCYEIDRKVINGGIEYCFIFLMLA